MAATYMAITVENAWKKGSAELLILSLLDAQPRHGYDIGKLIRELDSVDLSAELRASKQTH
jgi:DNA-binding PadR family transcriptional regulator